MLLGAFYIISRDFESVLDLIVEIISFSYIFNIHYCYEFIILYKYIIHV